MKKRIQKNTSLLVAIFSILMSINLVQAQQSRPQGPPPTPTDKQIEKMVEDLDETLSLTDDQEKQISQKYFAHFDEVKAKVKDGKPKREEMEKLKTEFEADVKSVLTDDQQDLYSSYIKEQKQNRPQRQSK